MQVCPNFSGAALGDVPQHGDRPRLDCDLIRGEIRGPDAPAIERTRKPSQLLNVLHGDPGSSRNPVVLLGVHGDN